MFDLEDGDPAVADALDADDRILAQEEAAVAVAGVEFVCGPLTFGHFVCLDVAFLVARQQRLAVRSDRDAETRRMLKTC